MAKMRIKVYFDFDQGRIRNESDIKEILYLKNVNAALPKRTSMISSDPENLVISNVSQRTHSKIIT